MKIISTLLALAVALRAAEAFQYSACLFQTCECVGENSQEVVVRCQRGSSSNETEFPIPYPNRTDFKQPIKMFFVFASKISKSRMDYALSGLTINTINFLGNNMEAISRHMLDGVNGLEKLSILEMMLRTVEPGAFDWISPGLKEISFIQSGISNAVFEQWLPELKKLTALTKIDLTRNNLTSINDGYLDSFTQLETLILERNRLEYLSPNAFKMNSKLKHLNLGSNSFKNIDAVLTGLGAPVLSNSLKLLFLDDNRLSELGVFPILASLDHLGLSRNMLKSLSGVHFKNLRNLQSLDAGVNQIDHIDEDFGYYLNKLVSIMLEINSFKNMTFFKYLSSPSLNYVSLGYQRNQLVQLVDYSFERPASLSGKTDKTRLEVDLTNNLPENISSKAFCSRTTFDLGIKKLIISEGFAMNINKCLLMQLQATDPAKMVEIEIQSSYNVSEICGCNEFRLLAHQWKVNLTGVCNNYQNLDMQECQLKLGPFVNDCYKYGEEFMCPPVSISSSTISPLGVAALVIGGVVVGAVLFVSFALIGSFLMNRFK